MTKLTKPQNRLFKQLLVFLFISIGVTVGASVLFANSPWVTEVGHFKEQPIPFSHETHVDGVGLNCQYCHTGVTRGNLADMPSTETCYGCHRDVIKQSEIIRPIQKGMNQNRPLIWNKVNSLADHVHFNHQKHIQKGVDCTTCHGDVKHMPLMNRANHFSMEYCLSCHKNQGPQLQDCYTCHR